jgi:hypothetical protein
MAEPETRIVMRPQPGFRFWRAVILAGGALLIGNWLYVAFGFVAMSYKGYREPIYGSDPSSFLQTAGVCLFMVLTWLCIIDRRLPRMRKTALSSQPQNSGREPTK